MTTLHLWLASAAFLLAALGARAGEATVAVAANFLGTATSLAAAFEAETGHEIRLVHGSTGRLYAQILRGAPFDVFLAADAARPARLVAEGQAVARRTYALGRLVLVARAAAPGADPAALMAAGRVALADPAVAPYGAAAMQAIAAFGLDAQALDLVRGDSVGQTASLLVTGNADLAFLARAQLVDLDPGLAVFAMDGRHAPIRQDSVLLSRGADMPAATAFFDWLATPEARTAIAAASYGVPE